MEASITAKKAAQECLSHKHFADWLEASRLLLLTGHELDSLFEFETLLTPLQEFEKDSDGVTKASALYLMAHYLLLKNSAEAETAIAQAISTSASTQNLECLARSLALASFFYAREANKNLAKSLEYLDKLDIMIQELSLFDLSITSLIYRSFINGDRNQFERAQELIWLAYEKAQHHGHQLALPTILAQIARLHKQQNNHELFQMYSELALRGVSAQRHPRLYKQISEFCSYYSGKPVSAFDFILDEAQSMLRERDKGYIDFRNQHILLELAVLFLKNPGMRYSKEDLIEIIWKQAYDPESHDNLIYVSIKRLRLLMEPNSESPKYILRDRKGYYLSAQTQIQVKSLEENKV